MSSFTICTNLTNQAGLQHDYWLLRRRLEELGHTVTGFMFNDHSSPVPVADVTIFIEVINGRLIPKPADAGSRKFWYIPNAEWYFTSWDGALKRMHKVLCKTKHCLEIFNKLAPGRSVYLGFESNDIYLGGTPKQRKFLHTAGKSETKNTKVVCEAWRLMGPTAPPLTVSAFKPEIRQYCQNVPNLTLVERFNDHDIIAAVNSHRFLIMPSKQEGFGHAIHEAAGCRSTILTTNADPMKGFGVDSRMLIPSVSTFQMRAATAYEVGPNGVRDAVERALALTDDDLEQIGDNARKWFLNDKAEFRSNLARIANG